MYPFFRLVKTVAAAANARRKGEKLTLTDTGEIEFTSSLIDLDIFLEMNNGRVLTLYDLGRNDFALRSGLGKPLLKKGWSFVVAGTNIQYRKRVRAFKKITIKTKVAGFDDKWIYMQQSMWVEGKPASSALFRTAVTSVKTGKVVEIKEILNELGMPDLKMPLTGWMKTWAESDELKPWPPT